MFMISPQTVKKTKPMNKSIHNDAFSRVKGILVSQFSDRVIEHSLEVTGGSVVRTVDYLLEHGEEEEKKMNRKVNLLVLLGFEVCILVYDQLVSHILEKKKPENIHLF
jgi:hypothetical protein